MQKLISTEIQGGNSQDPDLFYNLQWVNCLLSPSSHSVPPLPDRGKRKYKLKKVFLKKYEGPRPAPGPEMFTPLPIQEPKDHFDFSDPTNDLKLQMNK